MGRNDQLARAAHIIRTGGLVAFPTETVYGLGANALDPAAVTRLFAAKDRPASSPLIVHVADLDMARSIASEWPAVADVLAQHFWPGPLTLVVKKASSIPDLVTSGLDSVGIRIPAHPVALQLIKQSGVPIAAPSANRFMHLSPTTAQHVRSGLGDRVGLILDGGATTVGIESTVVSLVRREPTVLRPGMIALSSLEAVTGLKWLLLPQSETTSESPGMHVRHYSPRTPFFVFEPDAKRPPGRGRILDLPSDPASYAEKLYAELHQADSEAWDWIAVEQPPDAPEWTAIRDRLGRACSKL